MSNQNKQTTQGQVNIGCNFNLEGDKEYKGIYFNDNEKNEKYFDQMTGAHFNFEDICQRLKKLTSDQEHVPTTNSTIKIRKQKVCRLRKHAGTELKLTKEQANIDESTSNLKSKILARRVRNVDQKYSKTIKDLSQGRDEQFCKKNQGLRLESENTMYSSQQKQDDQAIKAKIIENRRHIKNIITKGKDMNNYKLPEKCESRNTLNHPNSSKYCSAGELVKLNLNQDITNNSIRKFHETTCINESQNCVLLSDSKTSSKAKGALFSKPPLISRIKAERDTEARNLLVKKNTIACRRRIIQSRSKSRILMDIMDNRLACN